MNPHCECSAAGFCTRHQIPKGPRVHDHCKGTSNLPDCGLKYWNAWEQGQLGATKPDDPKPDPEEWTCNQSNTKKKTYKRPEKIGKGPGTELKKLLSSAGIKPSAGCSCNSQAATMDKWGCDRCRKEIEVIVSWLIKNSRQYRWARFIPRLGKEITARALINKAIDNAEKLEQSEQQNETENGL